MPLRASAEELRLALVTVMAAASMTTVRPLRCADIMDHAAAMAAETPDDTVLRSGARAPGFVRLQAVRVISAVCANCGACERGRPEPCATADTRRET